MGTHSAYGQQHQTYGQQTQYGQQQGAGVVSGALGAMSKLFKI